MTTYHQVLGTAGPADAITDMAVQMRDELRRLGASELFAWCLEADTVPSVRAFQDLPLGDATDVLIVHTRLNDPQMVRALLRRPERLVLAYHGTNPTGSPTDRDADLAAGHVRDRDGLTMLKERISVAVAGSEFDAGELVALGYTAVHVASELVRPSGFTGLPGHDATDLELDEAVGVPYVLSIASLLPHSCQHVLVHALHVVQSVHRTELGLVLVGATSDMQYTRALHELTQGLRLRDVWFAGPRSDSSLAAIHRRARVFSSASREARPDWRHPFESMRLGVPTVVRESETTAETVGHGGLVLPRSCGPLMFAEAILVAHQDERVRSSLIASGFNRVSEYAAARPTSTFADILVTVGLTP